MCLCGVVDLFLLPLCSLSVSATCVCVYISLPADVGVLGMCRRPCALRRYDRYEIRQSGNRIFLTPRRDFRKAVAIGLSLSCVVLVVLL